MRSRAKFVTRLSSPVCLTAIALLGLGVNANAEKPSAADANAAKVYGDAYSLSISNAPEAARSMRISGPNGYSADSRSLALSSGKPLADGLYKYEITGAIERNNAKSDARSNRANGRSEMAKPGQAYGVIASGTFRIVNGTVFEPGNIREEKSSGPTPAERSERGNLR